jgi:DNA invertase Pin-like site-specific DNA recombinase
MVSVSQWEREAIGERTRDAMRHERGNPRLPPSHCFRLVTFDG